MIVTSIILAIACFGLSVNSYRKKTRLGYWGSGFCFAMGVAIIISAPIRQRGKE